MELNLSEIVWPICLLKCNATLQQMKPGDHLLITVEDGDIVDHLVQIITSHPDLGHDVVKGDDGYRILVRDLRSSEEANLRKTTNPNRRTHGAEPS